MRTVRPALHGLIDAMNDAEQDHRIIPCKNGDLRWWSDILTPEGVRQLRDQCRYRCPVLAQCNKMRVEAKALKLPITGIVAGVHLDLGRIKGRVKEAA